jgi:hypothetical protein
MFLIELTIDTDFQTISLVIPIHTNYVTIYWMLHIQILKKVIIILNLKISCLYNKNVKHILI